MLQAENIHKIYNNGAKALHVLKGIDMNIGQGEFAVITGPSGAGKSTLLHILSSLDFPTEGKMFFKGRDINKTDEAELSRIRNDKIGFVFQFYHLLSEWTVLENVIMPAMIRQGSAGTGLAPVRNKAKEILEKLGILDRSDHFPNQLSGGERQRTAMARALINAPEILFCDEPTGNLDSMTGQQIINLIKKINIENKMAIVLVTHNLELAKMADKIYCLRDGRIYEGLY